MISDTGRLNHRGTEDWLALEKAIFAAVHHAELGLYDINSQYIVQVGLKWYVQGFGLPAFVELFSQPKQESYV